MDSHISTISFLLLSSCHITENSTFQKNVDILEGQTFLLILSYKGTEAEHLYQLECTKGIVSPTCYKRFEEHLNARFRRYTIELPCAAMIVASPMIRDLITFQGLDSIVLDFGEILPAYALEVIDWYIRAIREKKDLHFPLPQSSCEDAEGMWYYYYVYIAMRRLGMDAIAYPVQIWLEERIEYDGLGDDQAGLITLLSHLSLEDPLYAFILNVYADYAHYQALPIPDSLLAAIVERFPNFREGVTAQLKDLQSRHDSGVASPAGDASMADSEW